MYQHRGGRIEKGILQPHPTSGGD